MRNCLIPLLVMMCGFTPVRAWAQTQSVAPEPFIRTEGLPTVYVTDTKGVEHGGKLIRVAAEEIVLRLETDDRERTFARGDILRIDKRGDSLVNGALIGAAIGALPGFFVASFADCPGRSQDGCPGTRIAGFLFSVGLYSAVGTGIDAAIKGRTNLYRAPKVALHAAPGRAQIGFRVTW